MNGFMNRLEAAIAIISQSFPLLNKGGLFVAGYSHVNKSAEIDIDNYLKMLLCI